MNGTIKIRKTNWGTFTIYIMLFLVLLAANGLVNFIIADFDWGVVNDPTYWFKTVTGSASGLFAFILFSLLRRDSKVVRDEIYNKEVEELNKVISSSVGSDFVEFVAAENRILKIETWKQNIQDQITKWNDKVSARVLLEKRLKPEEQSKKTRKSLDKLDKLNSQLNPKWIEENIDYIKIKHPKITVGEIINGERGASNTKLIDNNVMGLILKERVPIIVVNVAIQILYNSLQFAGVQSTAAMWLNIAIQLITIFTNVAIGLNYGTTLFLKLDKNNLLVRKNYVMKYLERKTKTKSNFN